MAKNIFIATMLITCSAHAMEDITFEPITNKEQLQELITESTKMFDDIYAKTPLALDGQQQYSNQHRAGRLTQLLSIAKERRHDAFVTHHGTRIGGLATHLDKDESRVILDRADLGTNPETKKLMYGAVMFFIKQNYPQCTTIWTATPKANEGTDKLPQPVGFEKSDYIDEFHDSQFIQGWERKLQN